MNRRFEPPDMGGDYECPSNNCGEWLEFQTEQSRVKCKGCGRSYDLEGREDGLTPVEAQDPPRVTL